jgi:hypothetical protein
MELFAEVQCHPYFLLLLTLGMYNVYVLDIAVVTDEEVGCFVPLLWAFAEILTSLCSFVYMQEKCSYMAEECGFMAEYYNFGGSTISNLPPRNLRGCGELIISFNSPPPHSTPQLSQVGWI